MRVYLIKRNRIVLMILKRRRSILLFRTEFFLFQLSGTWWLVISERYQPDCIRPLNSSLCLHLHISTHSSISIHHFPHSHPFLQIMAVLDTTTTTATTTTVTDGIVTVKPKPQKGLTSKAIDLIEKLVVRFSYDSSKPQHYLSGDFAPVVDETPPCTDLTVIGQLPVRYSLFYFYCINCSIDKVLFISCCWFFFCRRVWMESLSELVRIQNLLQLLDITGTWTSFIFL